MKKCIAIIAAMLFVLGFAASAFAIHAEIPAETSAIVVKGESTITLGGEIRMRGEIKETDFDSDTDTTAGYDGRVRIGMDVKVAPNASGYIQLETGKDQCTSDIAAGEDVECNGDTTDTYTWGDPSGGSASTGLYGSLADAGGSNAKRGDLRLIQGWINYKPTDVIGIKVGHMPLALGNKIFFNHTKFGDDAIVVYADPNKQVHISALTIKFEEGGPGWADADAYVGLVKYSGGKFNIWGDYTYVGINSNTATGFGVGGPSTVNNFGVGGDVTAGPVLIRFDGEYQTGNFGGSDGADIDQTGAAYMVGVDFKLGPTKLILEGGLGTGFDLDDDPDELSAFITALGAHGNAPLYTYVYDYRVAGICGSTQMGICGTTYGKVGAAGKATKTISWKAQIVYLQGTEEALNGEGDETDDIGTEVDAAVSFQLAKGLKYWIEGGYLSAGELYEDANGDVDPAWAIRNGIALNF